MRPPVVSFIIPVYRPVPEQFRAMLESVVRVARYYGPAEILLYNDASPDNAAELLAEAHAQNPDLIRTMGTRTNGGIGKARCEMTAQSRGRYVVSFDQDDLMLPFDLRGIVELLDANPRFCASYARKFLFDRRGLTGEVHGAEYSWFSAFFTPKININAMVIRKSDLLRHESFRPLEGSAINDDVSLMLRFAEDMDYHYDPRPRTLYRSHTKQNSQIYLKNNERDFQVMAARLTTKYQTWFDRIIKLDIPEITEENHRVIEGLIGLGVFLNQRNYELASALCRISMRIRSDDYGSWEHALLVEGIARRKERFDELYEEAMEHFKDSLHARFFFTAVAMRNAWQYQRRDSIIEKRFRALKAEYWKAPDIVLDHLPLIDSPSPSSYSIAGLNSQVSISV